MEDPGGAGEGVDTGERGKDGLPALAFADAASFEAWITGPGAQVGGIWLKIAKKGSGAVSATYAEAVEVALRHGWIDGQKGRWDDVHFVQRFTPRRPGSVWSRVNRDAAEALIAAGRMSPAGLEAVEAARARGTWERAYEPASTASVPDDLRTALDAVPAAAEAFEQLDGQNRYAVLYRVQQARRPATRAARIEGFVAMLARGETLYPRPARSTSAASRASSAAPAASSDSSSAPGPPPSSTG